jgi:hypothetical protein
MSRCKACDHPRRAEIDKDLIERKMKLSDIVYKYGGVSESGLSSHRLAHIKEGQSGFVVPPNKERSSAKIVTCSTGDTTSKLETIVTSVRQLANDAVGKQSIDDAILLHRIEIVRLEHRKSLGEHYV